MSEPDRYEIGYRDGESSATADWVFALSEWTQIGDDVATPADAVAYVQRLEAKVARIEALADSLEWKRPPVSPCAEYDFPCCSPDQCDAMQPSVSVVGARTIREALADPTEAQQ